MNVFVTVFFTSGYSYIVHICNVFYLQVVSGLEAGVIKDLGIEKEQKFAILSEQTTASDLSNLQETLHAFKQLQFSADHMKQIFQVSFSGGGDTAVQKWKLEKISAKFFLIFIMQHLQVELLPVCQHKHHIPQAGNLPILSLKKIINLPGENNYVYMTV